jgi:hypothetical protein
MSGVEVAAAAAGEGGLALSGGVKRFGGLASCGGEGLALKKMSGQRMAIWPRGRVQERRKHAGLAGIPSL